MAKFNEQYVFTGMQRDIDVSKHPASFLYDARNIRLTQRDGKDTLYAITNEKGTTPLEVAIQGSYLGHTQINNFLVIFSTDGSTDYISTIDLNSYITTILYEGNLNFDINYPITAVGSYENENIQKVYWTDGKNQPRMINIAGTIRPGIDTQFDFLPELALNETVIIKKQVGSVGSFPAGVLQYMLTYYNKHGHESNIFYTSPLLYVSPADRGAAPDEKVSNSFQINISNVDLNFDYLRIYSIHRSSINGTPSAKLVEDIAIISEPTDEVSSGSGNIVRFPNLFEAQLSSDSAFISGLALSQKGYLTSTQISLADSEEEVFWYVFRYSDCPELRLRYYSIDAISQEERVNYITWGDPQQDSQEDRQGWVIYVTEVPVTIKGTKGATILCFDESGVSRIRKPLKYVQKRAAETSYSYIDTGTRGESIDPMELLYKQKDKVVGGTIEQKDGTLFLGNLSYSPTILEQKDVITNAASLGSSNRRITFLNASNDSIYNYQNQLTSFESSRDSSKSVPCGGFKTGEYYRLGVQFQDKYGKWSDPIYIDDISEDVRPVQNDDHTVDVPTFTGFIPSSIVSSLKSLGYKKARAVVVYPDIQDREILCQGVTSPTVYRENDFNKNKVAGQSSWFFRPRHSSKTKLFDSTNINICAPVYEGVIRTSAELENLGSIETFNTSSSEVNKNSPRLWEIQGYYQSANRFNVFSSSFTDTNRFGFDTMHTPDVEFDSNVINQKFNNTRYKLVGYTKITTTLADIDIQTKSPTISNMGSGFDHQSFTASSAKGIISGLFYDDFVADELGGSVPTFIREYTAEQSPVKWLVYPWHRDGSLNNDINRPANAGVRSAELKIKKLSNLRYGKTVWGYTIKNWNQGPFDFFSPHVPELFYSDEPSIVKVGNYIYKGNIDTVLIPDISDGIYFCYNDSPANTSTSAVDSVIGITPRLLNEPNVVTPIDSTSWWKTFAVTDEVNATPTESGTVKVHTDSSYGAVRILLNGATQKGNEYSGVVGTILNLQVKPIDNYTVKCWRRGSDVYGREIAGTEGYEMLTVSIGAGITEYFAQLTMTSSSSVPSNMATVELAVNPANAGSITGLSSGQYPIGSQHTLEAVANTSAGYVFNQWQNWSGTTLSTSSTLNIVVASGGNYYKALFNSSYTVTALGDYNIANAYVGLESNPTTSSVVLTGSATVYLRATANANNAVIGWLKESNNTPSIVSYTENTTQQVNSASTFKAITTRLFPNDSVPVTFRVYVVYEEQTLLYDEITEDVASIVENTQEDGETLHYPEDTYTYYNRIDSIFLPRIGNSDFTFYSWGIGSVVDQCSSYAYWDNAESNIHLALSSEASSEESLCLILQTTTTYTLTLSKSGGDSTCTMSSNPNTPSILAGRKVTITAVSGSGYRFSGWYMDSILVSTSSSYEFNILDDVEYTAHFEANPTPPNPAYTLLINNNDTGTVNIQKSDSSTYAPNKLTVSVQKNDGSTKSTLDTLDSIASEGLSIQYVNSSTSSWTGRVEKQWNDIIDSKGTTTVNLIKDGVVKSSITVNLQVKVTFRIIVGSTTISSGSINDGISDRSNGTYAYYQIADTTGQTYTPTHSFTANAGSESYVFVNWQVNEVDYPITDNPISLALTDVTTLTAVFAQATTYTINVESSPIAGGTVSGGGTYIEGTLVTINASPNSGYTFTGWQFNRTTVSTASTYQITAGSSTAGTYTAVFTQGGTTYNVSAVVIPENTGTVSGTGSVASGNTATLEATPIPASPYSFLMWTSNDNYIALGTGATYETPAITSNITYRAFFTQYRITFRASSNAYTKIGFTAYIYKYNGDNMPYDTSYTGLSTSQPYSFLKPAIDGYTLRIVMNDSTTMYHWADTTAGISADTVNGVVDITISSDMNLVLGQ